MPRESVGTLSLQGRPTYSRGLGRWFDGAGPRRRLLIADAAGASSAELAVTPGSPTPNSPPPAASLELLERSGDPGFVWETHKVNVDFGGRQLGLALGLRTGDAVHWWEACRLVVREQTPHCRVVEVGGAIPLVKNAGELFRMHPNLTHPFLHKHNWLHGKLTLRLHANGVCEVFARHINNRYVDEGGDLAPAVPVIGFFGATAAEVSSLSGEWDGSRDAFSIGGNAFDVSDAAALSTPEQPGRFFTQDRALVWQPYMGCELYGGACPRQRTGDAYILRAQQQTILRGMSRTIRFSFSLSDRPAHVARYLAPAWWYGRCEELVPAPLLPARTPLEDNFDDALMWMQKHTWTGGFEDGSVGRYMPDGRSRPEPGWEGEIPYAMFLQAWRSGDPRWHSLAMRAAYCFTDIAIDHGAKLVRMHGYPPTSYSLPMCRTQGTLAAFLETGDDFLLDTARAVVEAGYRQHLNSWPRLAVGRDACFVRSALLIYRYTGNDHFLLIARAGIDAVLESQRDNGSFGDQGGGTGIHQYSGYMSKPWMGLLAIGGVLDWIELIGEDDRMLACVRKLADWFMRERVDLGGAKGWRFLHDYAGGRDYLSPQGKRETLPLGNPYHHESIARLLGFAAIRWREPAYLLAWRESRSVAPPLADDHPISAALQFVPWLETRLANVRFEPGGWVADADPLAKLVFQHHEPATAPTA